MKRFVFTLILLATSVVLFAQTPETFQYQAVVRDNSGNVLENKEVSFRISVLKGSTDGNALYSEEHQVTTNNFGLVNLQIGGGSQLSGDFSAIEWEDDTYFLKVELDEQGGSDYSVMGTSPLLSVPYAMHAQTVTDKDDADADPENEIQNLTLENDTLTITLNDNSAQIDLTPYLDSTDADADPENEIQDLNLSGNTLTITLNGNPTEIDLSPYLDNQTISYKNDTLSISDGNEVVLPYDSSQWKLKNDNIVYLGKNVGVGSTNPRSKLEVMGDSTFTEKDTLFSVKDKDGNIVFAVFPDGAKVYVNSSSKGNVGGFAVSGRTANKASEYEVMRVTPDSTRFYLPESTAKGKVGGFAVSGRTANKAESENIFLTSKDSTRVYVTQDAKSDVGGFAVSGRSATKGTAVKFMDLTKENYFIGHQSGLDNTTGLYNSFFGYQSGRSNTEGSNNVFSGYGSGYNNTKGGNNVFIGNFSGYANTTGNRNVMIGYLAGRYNTTASNNINIGYFSGFYNSTGEFNTYLGYNSGYRAGYQTTADPSYNTYIGYETGYNMREGIYNTFIGYRSGYGQNAETTTGSKNTALGYLSGYSLTSGSNNVLIGNQSGYKLDVGKNNVMVGDSAGFESTGADFSVFLGEGAGRDNTTGDYNTLIGYQAGYSTGGSSYTTAIGYQAGYSLSSWQAGTYVGYEAGKFNTGRTNVFVGSAAGRGFTSGADNVAIGRGAGGSNDSPFVELTGDKNTYLGWFAGYKSASATENVIVGAQPFTSSNPITGSYNVYLGSQAGNESGSASKNVFIGYRAGLNETNSDRLYIDNTSTSSPLIYGQFDNNRLGINTGTPTANLHIKQAGADEEGFAIENDGDTDTWSWEIGANDLNMYYNGTKVGHWDEADGSYTAVSDIRFKKDISDYQKSVLTDVMNLKPVRYRLKHASAESKKEIGFIAQDVKKYFPELVKESEDGTLGLDYQEFGIVAIKAIQEQQKLIEKQNKLIKELEERISRLENKE